MVHCKVHKTTGRGADSEDNGHINAARPYSYFFLVSYLFIINTLITGFSTPLPRRRFIPCSAILAIVQMMNVARRRHPAQDSSNTIPHHHFPRRSRSTVSQRAWCTSISLSCCAPLSGPHTPSFVPCPDRRRMSNIPLWRCRRAIML